MLTQSETRLTETLEEQRVELARLQAEIERTRQRHREMFERASVSYLILDDDGVIEDSNDAAHTLLGWPRTDLHQREFEYLLVPEHRAEWHHAFGAARKGRPSLCELEVLTADGGHAAVRIEAVVLQRGYDVLRFLITLSDNRARVAAEKAMQNSEAHYRQLFHVNPVPMLLLARDDFAVLSANPAAGIAFGIEFSGNNFLTRVHDEDRTFLIEWIRRGERGVIAQPLRLKRPSGNAMLARVSAHDVVVQKQNALLFLVEDVTIRWHAEREAHRAIDLLRGVIAASPVGMVCVGLRGEIQIINAAAERIFGVRAEGCEGQLFYERSPTSELKPILRQALGGKVVSATDISFHSSQKPFRSRHLTVSAAPICQSEGGVSGAVIALVDVTEPRQIEEQLRRADKLRAIGALSGCVAHDINNTLMVTLGCTSSISAQLSADSDCKADVDTITNISLRAARLTRELLTVSHQQSDQHREVAVDTSVRDYVQEFLRRTIPENVTIGVDLSANDASIGVDPSQLQRVILNLVLNARDAMPHGGAITIKTSIDVTPEPPMVTLEVEDTGIGMTADVRERIFEPFFTTKSTEKNSGFGLWSVFHIVNQAGGAISVDSAPGLGTRFRVVFPSVTRQSYASTPPPRMQRATRGECLLLVEDDPNVRRALSRGLTRCGFRVLDASGYDEAIALLESHHTEIQILLTDLVMPVASGLDVARAVRKALPDVPVVFMSGHASESFAPPEELRQFGTTLPKPFTPEAGAAHLREVMSWNELPQSIQPVRRIPNF
jgi:two-component system, cell cycle sensor histidine kinase and response regulator CckA